MEARPLAILGATGSIGTTTLNVVRAHPHHLRIAGLAAHSRWRELLGPVHEFGVKTIALNDPKAAAEARASGEFPSGTRILEGNEGLIEIACLKEVTTVVSAVVGTAGCAPGLASAAGLVVLPGRVELAGRFERIQLLVRGGPEDPAGSERADARGCPPPALPRRADGRRRGGALPGNLRLAAGPG